MSSDDDSDDADGSPSLSEAPEQLSREPEEIEPTLGPSIPEVDVPEVPDPRRKSPTPGEDIDAETYGLFWRLVVVFDVAFLALALGPMFVYFEGDWEFGLSMTALGLVAFGYGVLQYRAHQADEADQADDADEHVPDS